jgi:hypothetical protein
MASLGFPVRKSQGAGGMTGGGLTSQLDAPPPNPTGANQPLTPGATPQMPSFGEMSQPLTAGTPGRATTPEVLMGVMSSLETIAGMYDSMASVVPDLASDFAMLKDLQQRVAAKLLTKGGQPASPTSPGLNFPGGGWERGA